MLFLCNMKKYLFILVLSLFSVSFVQAERFLPASTTVSSYRPEGELRVWTFIVRDSVLGQLRSQVVSSNENNDGIIVFNETLDLDYSKLGSELTMHITGDVRVSNNGAFVGNELELLINGQAEKQKLKRDDEALKGYITRGGERNNQHMELREGIFAVDNNFVDQFEMFFAMHDLRVGDTLQDSILVPQNMTIVPFSAVVREFTYKTFYNRVGDSVFVIDMIAPQQMQMLFTASKRLAKVIDERQKMNIYLDEVRVEKIKPIQPAFTLTKFISFLPNYAFYICLGLLSALFFVGSGFKWGTSWVGLGLGAILFVPVIFLQIPMQNQLFLEMYMPKISSGSSPYVWGLLMVLPAAVFQEGLKFASLYIPARNKMLHGSRLIAFGAMVGAGLGIIEGCYLDGIAGNNALISWALLERSFMIAFHATSGAILGSAISKNMSIALKTLGGTILVHLLLRYLPLFVQQTQATPQLMYLMLAIVVLIFLSISLLIMKRDRAS